MNKTESLSIFLDNALHEFRYFVLRDNIPNDIRITFTDTGTDHINSIEASGDVYTLSASSDVCDETIKVTREQLEEYLQIVKGD